jgi:hypothetical protein
VKSLAVRVHRQVKGGPTPIDPKSPAGPGYGDVPLAGSLVGHQMQGSSMDALYPAASGPSATTPTSSGPSESSQPSFGGMLRQFSMPPAVYASLPGPGCTAISRSCVVQHTCLPQDYPLSIFGVPAACRGEDAFKGWVDSWVGL